jgi:plasmid stabilization system protein ParE
MAEIRWTQEAVAWLEDIYRYIAQDNPQAAQRIVNVIYEKAQLLKTFPLLGHRHRSEPEGEIRILV